MCCFYHSDRHAVRQGDYCSKGLCADCDYHGWCYEHISAGIAREYGIAHGRQTRLLCDTGDAVEQIFGDPRAVQWEHLTWHFEHHHQDQSVTFAGTDAKGTVTGNITG